MRSFEFFREEAEEITVAEANDILEFGGNFVAGIKEEVENK